MSSGTVTKEQAQAIKSAVYDGMNDLVEGVARVQRREGMTGQQVVAIIAEMGYPDVVDEYEALEDYEA